MITDSNCSHEIKRHLLLGRKAMTNLDRVLKSRDITLPTNVHLVKAMVFPVIMYGCESWTIKKAEYQRVDAFELWCWRRLLRVPRTARRSKQSILKEIKTEYPLSQWCHPTISSFVGPFSSHPQYQGMPVSGSFPMSQLFTSGGQSIGALASVLPMDIQSWFLLGLTTLISLQS